MQDSFSSLRMDKCLERVDDRHFSTLGVFSYAMIPPCRPNSRDFIFFHRHIYSLYGLYQRYDTIGLHFGCYCFLSLIPSYVFSSQQNERSTCMNTNHARRSVFIMAPSFQQQRCFRVSLLADPLVHASRLSGRFSSHQHSTHPRKKKENVCSREPY